MRIAERRWAPRSGRHSRGVGSSSDINDGRYRRTKLSVYNTKCLKRQKGWKWPNISCHVFLSKHGLNGWTASLAPKSSSMGWHGLIFRLFISMFYHFKRSCILIDGRDPMIPYFAMCCHTFSCTYSASWLAIHHSPASIIVIHYHTWWHDAQLWLFSILLMVHHPFLISFILSLVILSQLLHNRS